MRDTEARRAIGKVGEPPTPQVRYRDFVIAALFMTCGTWTIFMSIHPLLHPSGPAPAAGPTRADARSAFDDQLG
jgi:hypothetical protein